MNNLISIAIGLLLVLGIGGVVYMQTQSSEAPPLVEPTQAVPTTPASMEVRAEDPDDDVYDDDSEASAAAPTVPAAPNAGATAKTYTAADVAQHNSRTSCWSSINSNVYDLTSWIPKHPGGEQGILRLCGTDGSARYNGQHGGAATQAAILVGFKIGTLK